VPEIALDFALELPDRVRSLTVCAGALRRYLAERDLLPKEPLVANVPVRPGSDTELVIEGTGWLMGETVHVVQRGGREALRYSGYEFQRVTRP